MTFSSYGLTAYDVQYWNGSSWVTISGGSVSGNNKVWRKFTFASITTTKIRVQCNAAADGYARVVELEAWTGPSPAPRFDLALGATATASSSAASGWGPSGVVNGDRKSLNWGNGGGWADAAPVNSFPDWLQVDFGTSKTIGEIDVFTLQDNYAASSEPTEAMTFTQWGLTGYDVQYWNGSSWITVPGGSVTGNNKVWRKFTFSPITTSKIRVLTNAAADGYSRLTEIEAYAPAQSSGTGGVHWLISDQLGTPRMIFDQTGGLSNVTRHDYLPFGEELVVAQGLRSTSLGYFGDNGVRQRFTQQERDVETGLDFFEARYYSSTQGRFTSTDSIGGTRFDPQSLNLYSYVLNNPLILIDPDGHASDLPCNFGGSGPCIGEFQDPNTSNLPPATKPGDPFPIASCLGCGSPTGIVAVIDASGLEPETLSTSSGVPATSIIERKPVLETNALDYLPVYGPARQFLFNYTTHNFEGALFSFAHLALDLSPLGTISSGSKAISLGLEYGPDGALTGAALARQLGVEGETAVRAVYDIGEKTTIRILGRLRTPDGLTDVVLSEVKNVKSLSYTRQLRDYAAFAAQTGKRFDLYVRGTTRLSGPLQEAVRSGTINLLTIPR